MKKTFKILLIAIFVLLVVMSASAFYVLSLFKPVDPSSNQVVTFTVPKGQAIITIGERLAEENLIRNPLAFRLAVKKENLGDKIQAGSFKLKSSMTTWEVARALTQGTNDLWITIPEGWRREEIAESLANLELAEFDQLEFLSLTMGLEGKLFPETYLVPKMMTTESLISLLSNTFEKKVEQGLAKEIAADGRSLDEIIIMASVVEREARGFEDMRRVAGILANRLEIDMALQADATLQYAKGYNKTQDSWWVPPTADDKELDSPFNTYKYPGLPPAPICNPGLNAIKATLNPIESDDIFYIHDRDGEMHYAETLEEHNANVNQYLR